MLEVKKKDGESASSLIYRFSKKIQQSGVMKEAKGRRYKDRAKSKLKRKVSALHKAKRKIEMDRARKWGVVVQ